MPPEGYIPNQPRYDFGPTTRRKPVIVTCQFSMTTITTDLTTSPREGDVVIAREKGGAAYTIRAVPGTPQLSYATYGDAVLAATAWALRADVALWFTEDGKTFTAM